MIKREQQAKRRYTLAWYVVKGDGFDMATMPLDNPRQVQREAASLAAHYERDARRPQHRLSKRDSQNSAGVLNALAAAAQSYVTHHERAEQERIRQAEKSE